MGGALTSMDSSSQFGKVGSRLCGFVLFLAVAFTFFVFGYIIIPALATISSWVVQPFNTYYQPKPKKYSKAKGGTGREQQKRNFKSVPQLETDLSALLEGFPFSHLLPICAIITCVNGQYYENNRVRCQSRC